MKLYNENATGCSWGGKSYEADADGAVDVPGEAAADLAFHGFTTNTPKQEEAQAVVLTGNPAKWTNDVLKAEAVRLGFDPNQDRPSLVKAVAEARKIEADEALKESEQE